MNDIHGIVARTTKFKESATLPFVIPSEAEESAVSPSQYRMLMEKSFCSLGAQPRDLQFRGPFLEMFLSTESSNPLQPR